MHAEPIITGGYLLLDDDDRVIGHFFDVDALNAFKEKYEADHHLPKSAPYTPADSGVKS